MTLIPLGERGVQIWESIDGYLRDLNSLKENEVLDENKLNELVAEKVDLEKMEKDLELLEDKLEIREKEIKTVKCFNINKVNYFFS